MKNRILFSLSLTIVAASTAILCALPTSASAAPSGKIVYYTNVPDNGSSVHYQIYIINGDGTGNTRLNRASDDLTPALSPDGTKIAFASSLGSGLFLMNADGTGAAAIPNASGCKRPAWSADGSKLAAIQSGTFDTIVTFNPDGSELHQVTAPGYPTPYEAAWSPDGTKLVFWDYDRALYGTQIYTVNADGASAPVRLSKNDNAAYRQPSWSPDGTKIACQINGAIYLLDPNTGAETRVTPPDVDISIGDESPTFSPDATQLAFQSSEDTGLGVMNLDGNNRHLLNTPRANDPKWSPAAAPTPSPGPTAPPHGGLSETTLTVNGSSAKAGTLTGPVLSFVAQQAGRPSGLILRVQYSKTPEPNDSSNTSWTDLPTGIRGRMTFDVKGSRFFLNTTGYPAQPGLYFRAISSAPAYPTSISNYVGAFDASNAGAHLPPVVLLFKPNGNLADLAFTAGQLAAPSGVALRIQTSTTPETESSWTDLDDGQAGHMKRSTNANFPDVFLLQANKVSAAGSSIYFRAIAQLSGSLDSISNVTSSYTLVRDVPPVVTLTLPAGTPGTGTLENPYIIPAGQIKFSASATADSSRPSSKIVSLKMELDGRVITDEPGATAFVDYGYTVTGRHDLEAVATDDLGATNRANAGLVYIDVVDAGDRPQNARQGKVSGAATDGVSTSNGKTYTAVTSGGLWSDPTTWKDSQGNNGVPGPNDYAKIDGNNGTYVRIGQATTVRSIYINGGVIFAVKDYPNPPTDLTVTGTMTVSEHGADMFNIHLTIPQGASFESLNNDLRSIFTGTVDNYGRFNLHGTKGIASLQAFNNHGESNFNLPVLLPPNATTDPLADVKLLQAGSVLNTGLIQGLNPGGLLNSNASLVGNAGGTLVGNAGGTLISQDGGGLISQDGGGLISQDGGGLISQDGGGLIGRDGSRLVASGAGNLVASGAGNVVNRDSGALAGRRTIVNSPAGSQNTADFTQTGGETNLSAVTILGSVALDGGILSGSGLIAGDLTNNGGYVSPGHSPGALFVAGAFTQGANGTLIVENGGATPDKFDQLLIGGTATLGGKLDVKLINGYTPDPADTFSPLAYGSVSGSFSSVSANAQVTMGDTGLLSSVNPAFASPAAGQPVNISTRMEVQTGNNVLIGGFIIVGPSGTTKKVLIRGIGPSLSGAGLSGVLSDPLLELHKPDGSTVTNDNWGDAPNKDQLPNGFAPSDAKESIILVDLAPGTYTVIEKGAQGATGIGLTEIYDMDSSTAVALVNISTRGFVDTGNNVMIGGFIVGGNQPAQILVRVSGPSLSGVTGVLADPMLELHDANGNVISNDDWRETQEAEIIATTVPPNDNHEPAILATLVPGTYTAIVRGKNNTTGIAVVEAYKIK